MDPRLRRMRCKDFYKIGNATGGIMVISLTTAVVVVLASAVFGFVAGYFVMRNTKNGVKNTADEALQRVEQRVDEIKNHLDQNRPL
jgi:FlaG/FlaF family flagellin (archaellin)